MRAVEQKIKKHYTTLLQDLDLENSLIVDTLYEKGILNEHEKETVEKEKLSRVKNKMFLAILMKKKDQAYTMFRDTLQECGYEHLYRLLDPLGIFPKQEKADNRENSEDSCESEPAKCFEDLTVKDLQEWLKRILEKYKLPLSILETFRDEQIDGEVFKNMTNEELDKLLPSEDVKFGPRKRLMIERDKAMEAMECQNSTTRPIYRLLRTEKTVKYRGEYMLRKQTG